MAPKQNDKEKQKVLYIDDDPINRTLVNRLLTAYDFQILEAETGLEGINIARKELPNLILMDINMPGLDGHETTTKMRSISPLKQTPIIALTARTTTGERELALAAGCDGYIPKPIDVDDFPHQVISYLRGYRDTITKEERQYFLDQYSRKLVERLEGKINELEEANHKLQKLDKVKSDFITLAAHELRTPITLIYGYARLLQMMTCKTEEEEAPSGGISDLAGRIFTSIHRLNETVNDILNISLIEADEMHLARELVKLDQIFNPVLKELTPAKHGRVLEIGVKQLDTLPSIIGDPQRLQQAFWNLLSNAIKFTPDGGSILVKGQVVNEMPALAKEDPASTSSAKKEQSGLLISIMDTGIGIDPADQEQIFECFYVVANTAYHSSSKTDFGGGGMGLGLPITRGIIDAHNGQIWVESSGQDSHYLPGSTFHVFLPFDGPSP